MAAYYENPAPEFAYKNLAELLRLFATTNPALSGGVAPASQVAALFASEIVTAGVIMTLTEAGWSSVNITNFSDEAATVNGKALPAGGFLSFSVPYGMKAPALAIVGIGAAPAAVRVDVVSYSGVAPVYTLT